MNIQNSVTILAPNLNIPQELLNRLGNSSYFLHQAINHMARCYIPTIQHLAEHGETALILNQLDAMQDYILALEQYNGIQDSIDLYECMYGDNDEGQQGVCDAK